MKDVDNGNDLCDGTLLYLFFFAKIYIFLIEFLSSILPGLEDLKLIF